MDKDVLAAWLAEGRWLEEIARLVGRHPSTVAHHVRKHALEVPNAVRHAARGGLERALLVELCAQNLTIRQIAAAVDRSPATVRHWLRRYDLRTTRAARLRTRADTEPGERFVSTCRHHGEVEFVVSSRDTARCVKCRLEAVSRRRRHVKRLLVEEAGGACVLCGYDRHLGALQFHHVDPTTKRFALSLKGVARAVDDLREEARKCVLVCANCHAEVEAGAVEIPASALHHLRG